MRRTLPLAVAAVALSCMGHALTAPTPLSFHTARSPRDATQSAALALVSAGFRVAQTDSAGFALNASRTATHNANQEFVTCSLPAGSAAAANRETTLFISFRAAPAQEGSDVRIGSRVTTSYPGYAGTTMQVPPSDSVCVSSGTMERRLESSLR